MLFERKSIEHLFPCKYRPLYNIHWRCFLFSCFLDSNAILRVHWHLYFSKTKFKTISRHDRECEEAMDYNWGDCLDEMFYLRKGCQDPWNVNPKVPLPVCTNVTYILASYGRGPAKESYGKWDQEFWDRHYMAEMELAGKIRDGMRCKTPCSQTYYSVKHSFTNPDMWAYPQEWASAIKIVYKNLRREER